MSQKNFHIHQTLEFSTEYIYRKLYLSLFQKTTYTAKFKREMALNPSHSQSSFRFEPVNYHQLDLVTKDEYVLFDFPLCLQVAGGCWYVLAIQRVASCIRQQCEISGKCNLSLSCSEEVCYQFLLPTGTIGNPCGGNSTLANRKPLCLDVNGPFQYGIYQWALPVISSNSLAVKILYPIFWGLMTLR